MRGVAKEALAVKRRVRGGDWRESVEDHGRASTGTNMDGGARGDQMRPLDAIQLHHASSQAGVRIEKGRADINEEAVAADV